MIERKSRCSEAFCKWRLWKQREKRKRKDFRSKKRVSEGKAGEGTVHFSFSPLLPSFLPDATRNPRSFFAARSFLLIAWSRENTNKQRSLVAAESEERRRRRHSLFSLISAAFLRFFSIRERERERERERVPCSSPDFPRLLGPRQRPNRIHVDRHVTNG